MQIDVRLTDEQKNAEPDFEKTLARFQRRYNDLAGDMRKKFRLCLHEGGHAMYQRRSGRGVRFHGPYIEHDGELSFILGAVSPVIGEEGVSLADYEHAAISMAGFIVVERLTGLPSGDTGHVATRFFPEFFDVYMALSAKPRISSGDLKSVQSVPQTPMLVVTGISPPGFCSSIDRLIRSAVARASSVEKSGRQTANSSPPHL